MKNIYLIYIPLILLVYAISSRQIMEGQDNCVACLGSLYPMCETNLSRFSCRSNAADADCKTNTLKSNILTTCHSDETPIYSDDAQCMSQYYVTRDYMGEYHGRVISVSLARNKICPIQIINAIDSSTPATITISTLNRANITYWKTKSTKIHFANEFEYDMKLYSLSTKSTYTLEPEEGIVFMPSNPYTNGTPTVFEVTY